MSGQPIKDGTGSGFLARVNAENALVVDNKPDEVALLEDGEVYNYNTGTITLTTDTKTSCLYIKNTGDRDLFIPAFIYLLGLSTGGAGDILVQVERNPKTGTLISAGSPAIPVNRNFGSGKLLAADSLTGSEGQTTDGIVAIESILQGSGRYSIPIGVILPSGTSLAVAVTPPAGNTAMGVQIAIPVFRLMDRG